MFSHFNAVFSNFKTFKILIFLFHINNIEPATVSDCSTSWLSCCRSTSCCTQDPEATAVMQANRRSRDLTHFSGWLGVKCLLLSWVERRGGGGEAGQRNIFCCSPSSPQVRTTHTHAHTSQHGKRQAVKKPDGCTARRRSTLSERPSLSQRLLAITELIT